MALTGTTYSPVADATLPLEGTQTADSPNVPSVDPIALDASVGEVATVAANKPIRKARGKASKARKATRLLRMADGRLIYRRTFTRGGNVVYRPAVETDASRPWVLYTRTTQGGCIPVPAGSEYA